MSLHFIVMVHLDGKIKKSDVPGTVAGLLAPFQEYGTGDGPLCPAEFLVFSPETYNPEYNRTKKQWIEDWGLLEHNGEFGDWINPNAKWDGWQIGGRWDGIIPILENADFEGFDGGSDSFRTNEMTADFARLRAIDQDAIEVKIRNGIERVQSLFDQKQWSHRFDQPSCRDYLFYSGHLQNKAESELTEADQKKTIVARPANTRRNEDRYDVIDTQINLSDEFARGWFHPLISLAFLDKNGWREPDESSPRGSPENRASIIEHCNWCLELLSSADPSSWIVVVDCHI